MSSDLTTKYYAIKDTMGRLVCGYDSKTNGLYSTPAKAQLYINRRLRPEYGKYVNDEARTWKIVSVRIVEVEE